MNNPAEWAGQARDYVSEVEVEFKKVTWPTQKETVAGTIGTCVIVLVMTVALFTVDAAIGWIIDALTGAVR